MLICIGVAVQLNALFALVLILFGVFLQKRHGARLYNKILFVIIKFIPQVSETDTNSTESGV